MLAVMRRHALPSPSEARAVPVAAQKSRLVNFLCRTQVMV